MAPADSTHPNEPVEVAEPLIVLLAPTALILPLTDNVALVFPTLSVEPSHVK